MAGSHLQRCRSNGRSGVAAKGFEDVAIGKIFVRNTRHLAIFVSGLEKEFTVGNSEGLNHIRLSYPAQPGFLQQALSIRQADKGFGMQFAGNRPEPRTCAATKNRRD